MQLRQLSKKSIMKAILPSLPVSLNENYIIRNRILTTIGIKDAQNIAFNPAHFYKVNQLLSFN